MTHEKVLVLIAVIAVIGAASYFQTLTGFGLSMIVRGATSGRSLLSRCAGWRSASR